MGRLIDEDYIYDLININPNLSLLELKQMIKKYIPTGFDEEEVILILRKNSYSWNSNLAPLQIKTQLAENIIRNNIHRKGK
jgi:hypothetical protein